MQIYIISKTAERMGVRLGAWFDLEDERYDYASMDLRVSSLEEDIQERVTFYDWEIRDTEGVPFKIPANLDLESLFRIQDLMSLYGEAFPDYVEYVGDLVYALDHFEDAYHGRWDDLEQFAHETLMDTDDAYKGAYEHFRGWTPQIDQVAWGCDYYMSDHGHVFFAAA